MIRSHFGVLAIAAMVGVTGCGEDKPLAAFVPIAGTRGFYGRCRACRAQRARERHGRDEAFRVKERARRAAGMRKRQAGA